MTSPSLKVSLIEGRDKDKKDPEGIRQQGLPSFSLWQNKDGVQCRLSTRLQAAYTPGGKYEYVVPTNIINYYLVFYYLLFIFIII